MDFAHLHITTGWIAILLCFVSGGVIGMFFHRDEWAGGYGSYRRRMLRLGHISFFGLGAVNLLFGLTLSIAEPALMLQVLVSGALVVAVFTMPLCCFLAAWRRSLRVLFPIPVAASLVAVVPVVLTLVGS